MQPLVAPAKPQKPSTAQIGSDAFAAMAESDVAPDAQFFHKYYRCFPGHSPFMVLLLLSGSKVVRLLHHQPPFHLTNACDGHMGSYCPCCGVLLPLEWGHAVLYCGLLLLLSSGVAVFIVWPCCRHDGVLLSPTWGLAAAIARSCCRYVGFPDSVILSFVVRCSMSICLSVCASICLCLFFVYAPSIHCTPIVLLFSVYRLLVQAYLSV